MRSSARTKEGMDGVFGAAEEFRKALAASGDFMKQRHAQAISWMWLHVENEIMDLFKRHPQILKRVRSVFFFIDLPCFS